MTQIPFLDELKQELLEHAPQPAEKPLPSRRRRLRLQGAWVAAAVFAATLVVGGLTWLLTGSGLGPSADAPAPLETFDVESLEVDGVWVFQHATSGGDDALHSGTAEIKGDCLYVDDAVVVWQEDQIDQATQLIASIKSGDEPQVSLPGGGTSLDEGETSLPASITDLCPTRTVWYTSPGP